MIFSLTQITRITRICFLVNAMKQIAQITHRLRSQLVGISECTRVSALSPLQGGRARRAGGGLVHAPDGSKGAAPTRYDSVGCDEGRFIFPEELLSKAKSKSVKSV